MRYEEKTSNNEEKALSDDEKAKNNEEIAMSAEEKAKSNQEKAVSISLTKHRGNQGRPKIRKLRIMKRKE